MPEVRFSFSWGKSVFQFMVTKAPTPFDSVFSSKGIEIPHTFFQVPKANTISRFGTSIAFEVVNYSLFITNNNSQLFICATIT